MIYNLTENQSYDLSTLNDLLKDTFPNGRVQVSGNAAGNGKLTIHNWSNEDEAAIDVIVQVHINEMTWDERAAYEEAKPSKIKGVEFEGVMCSATSEDMWGLASVKPWIQAGNDVNFHFSNGNKLVLTSLNLSAFEIVWTPFRASFF